MTQNQVARRLTLISSSSVIHSHRWSRVVRCSHEGSLSDRSLAVIVKFNEIRLGFILIEYGAGKKERFDRK